MSPWLKAGLIGGGVLAVLNLMSLIPCVGLVTCLLGFVAYAGIGALAAYWMPPLRVVGDAAGQGALAALVAGAIGGLVNLVVMTVQTATMDSAELLSQIPAETLEQMRELGLDPAMLAGAQSGLLAGSVCCLGGLVFAAILGAIGGAIFAGLKPD